MAPVNAALYKRYQFMKEHAGSIVGERAKGALRLAKAEAWLNEHAGEDVEVTWEGDEFYTEDTLGQHDYWCKTARRKEAGYTEEGDPIRYPAAYTCEHEVEVCTLWQCDEDGDPVAVLASLSGIIDADRTSRRVVEAELVLEAMDYDRLYPAVADGTPA